MSEEILAAIEQYADKAHGEQMRKYGHERYIVHPVRVMKMCRAYTNDVSIMAAALLHDVLEDTSVTPDEMKQYLYTVMDKIEAGKTLALVIELTDIYVKEDYPSMNRRARKNRELQRLEKTSAASQTIKYADIIDNCREISKYDPNFATLFLRECKTTLKKLDKGNPQLYEKAVAIVNEELEKLEKEKN